MWHPNVCDNDAVLIWPDYLQRVGGTGKIRNIVTGKLQCLARGATQSRVIIHQNNGGQFFHHAFLSSTQKAVPAALLSADMVPP